MTVDPDRWVIALHGQRYVRKVQRDTSVTIGAGRYYIRQALDGKHVTLRIDATDHTFVVEYASQEIKRVPIQGTRRERNPEHLRVADQGGNSPRGYLNDCGFRCVYSYHSAI